MPSPPDNKPWISQLRKGLIELAILAALRDQEAYGYQLLQRLGALDGLATTESTVYPILSRLAADKLVAVRTAPSPAGPPRRYYRLTPAGRQRLDEMSLDWRQLNTAVERLLDGRAPSPQGDEP